MAALKDRSKQIPNGFRFTQPQTNWQAPPWSSFDSIVKALMAHRRGNPALVRKHKWALDYDSVAFEVDTFNAALCVANGWTDFIVSENAEPPKYQPPQAERPGAAFVGAVKRSSAGIKLVVEWLGSGLKPVPLEVAEKRASVCVACPLNVKGNFLQKLEAAAADKVRALLAVKHDMALRTSQDANLGSCTACDCFLPLKIFSPLDLIQKNTSEEVRAKLDTKCWILSESL